MEALMLHAVPENGVEQKWTGMFVLSLIFHVVLFSSVFLVPDSSPTMRMRDVIYEVDLVDRTEIPQDGRAAARSVGKETRNVSAKAFATKRIGMPKAEEKAVVIAKQTVKVAAEKLKAPEISSARLLDQAVPKVETQGDTRGKAEETRAVSRVESILQSGRGTGAPDGRGEAGIGMEIYRSEVKSLITGNWSFPAAMLGPDRTMDLSAIVELRVDSNGTILSTKIIRSSRDAKFDQSVLNAVRRSDPLPPFPQGYRKTHEEFEINFNLSDLAGP